MPAVFAAGATSPLIAAARPRAPVSATAVPLPLTVRAELSRLRLRAGFLCCATPTKEAPRRDASNLSRTTAALSDLRLRARRERVRSEHSRPSDSRRAPGTALRSRMRAEARRSPRRADGALVRVIANAGLVGARVRARQRSSAGALCSTICVRHHEPCSSHSGSCATRPAACEIVEPALHAAAVRSHKPRTPDRIARDRPPADHRRQPHDQLRDRRRVTRRARRVAQPEQVALDRVRARLKPVIPGRRAAARRSRAGQQRDDHQPPGLGRQRFDRRPVPPARRGIGCALQRHRQRPRASRQHEALRSRTDARGTAGGGPASARGRDPPVEGLAICPAPG